MVRWAALLVLIANVAAANAPAKSLRPEARPGSLGAVILSEGPGVSNSIRPKLRPTKAPSPVVSSGGLRASLRPQSRTLDLERAAARRLQERARGQVCGDPDLQGERIAAVSGHLQGCRISEPVRLRSVSGVPLSADSVMDCPTAKALKSWVERGVKPAVGSQGGGVRSLGVAAHYSCRTRNNRPGAKLSEHGRGRAIDISSVRLRDGSEISVLRDWGKGSKGQALREMWRAACGPFGTVLGPEADRFHRDHFHFDTARYRSGPYCR